MCSPMLAARYPIVGLVYIIDSLKKQYKNYTTQNVQLNTQVWVVYVFYETFV